MTTAFKARKAPAAPTGEPAPSEDEMLTIDHLTKIYSSTGRERFGRERAVDDVSVVVPRGEFFTLLGPSGCGKTTLLRSIAGLERPTEGSIRVNGQLHFSSEEGIDVPAFKRNLGMVFQSYAIWPHMTVSQNASYPLKVAGPASPLRKLSKAQRRSLVEDTLASVGLAELGGRMATDLSGGQQQRLALARALIQQPPLLLLDEPLSNLDAKLRESMRTELRRLQQELGLTVIYVTHDQIEALSMSSRIAVMEDGIVQQVGTPSEIYQQPVNRFVGTFVGASNVLPATVAEVSGETATVRTVLGLVQASRGDWQVDVGRECEILIRPEQLVLARESTDERSGAGCTIDSWTYMGSSSDYQVTVGGQSLLVHSADPQPVTGSAKVASLDGTYPIVHAGAK